MYLKNIKLVGFKSFVDATSIPIRSDRNAIVGPNGCGKSNIVDAIRWVIGESSAKQLRGQSMTDVIFNGTTTRKPVGKASVELTFDNQDGRMGGEYARFSEVAVRREVTREGQSVYFINNLVCRRKDVVDIFLGTGLGAKNYAIIEQGMISQIVEAKPEEFRVYLEEVAGISKYKERRRETETRMQRTQENLNRVNDLCSELMKQLRRLKRQANTAALYQKLRGEKQNLQAEIKGLQWKNLSIRLEKETQQREELSREREQISVETLRLETEIEKRQKSILAEEEIKNHTQKRYYEFSSEIAQLQQRIKDLESQIKTEQRELKEVENVLEGVIETTQNQQAQMEEITRDLSRLTPQFSEQQASIKRAEEALRRADNERHTWQERWDEFQKKYLIVTQQFETEKMNSKHYRNQLEQSVQRESHLRAKFDSTELAILDKELHQLEGVCFRLENQLSEIQSNVREQREQIEQQRVVLTKEQKQLDQLNQEIATDQGSYASFVALQQSVVSSSQQIDSWLERQKLTDVQRLFNVIQVEKGWELAVEIVLSTHLHAVCVDCMDPLIGLLNWEQGQLTLLARQPVAHSSLQKKTPTLLGKTCLLDKITSEWPLNTWLSSVYTAETREEAHAIQKELTLEESVITPEGLWLGWNWCRRVRPGEDRKMGVLVREKEISYLAQRLSENQEKKKQCQQILKVNNEKLTQLEKNYEAERDRYQTVSAELARCKVQLSAKRSRHEVLTQQRERLSQEIEDCRNSSRRVQSSLEETEQGLAVCQEKVTALLEEKKTLSSERDRLNALLNQVRENHREEQKRGDELSIKIATNESQLGLLEEAVRHSSRQKQQLRERHHRLSAFLEEHEENNSENSLNYLKQSLQERLSQRVIMERELKENDQTLRNDRNTLSQLRVQLDKTQKKMQSVNEMLQSLQMACQSIAVRQSVLQEQLLEARFELTSVLEKIPEGATTEVWEQRLENINQKMDRLGPINLVAIEEYQQVSDRKVYLDQQQEDLLKSLEILEKAICKIDRETRQKFKETYDKVNENFQRLFPRILGGGRAELVLLEDNLLVSGVMIKAQPPGKKNTTIHLLSGGEKALAALSLVFSLFQLNPAPFCVLDEVDAPLDEVNVARFCELVKEMSNITQFIVISHNKMTIQRFDSLIGVTMQEAGVSRIVSVDMKMAMEMTETSQ